jgi:hypothetical protein
MKRWSAPPSCSGTKPIARSPTGFGRTGSDAFAVRPIRFRTRLSVEAFHVQGSRGHSTASRAPSLPKTALPYPQRSGAPVKRAFLGCLFVQGPHLRSKSPIPSRSRTSLRKIAHIDQRGNVGALLGEAGLYHDILYSFQRRHIGSQRRIAVIVLHVHVNVRAKAHGLGV